MSIKDAPKCTANKKKKNGGEKCQNPAMTNGKCRMHGGKSPKGLASPNLKHGLRSQYLTAPLAARADKFNDDPNIHEMKEFLGVQDVRITELYQELGTREPVEIWKRLKMLYEVWQRGVKDLMKMQEDHDLCFFENPAHQERSHQSLINFQELVKEMQNAFQTLLIDGCAAEEKAETVWKKIENATERRRKLAETQAKVIKDSGAFVSKDQFKVYNLIVQQIIIENVSDNTQRNAIADQFIQFGLSGNRAVS